MLFIEAHRTSIGTFHARNKIPVKSIVNRCHDHHEHISSDYYQNLKYLLYGLVVLTLIQNLYSATSNFSKLILENVETNPGSKLKTNQKNSPCYTSPRARKI